MNALEWLRTKAQQTETYSLEADEGKTVKVTRYSFKGRVQPRMVFELQKLAGELSRDCNGVYETLKTGGQYRSEFGNCEYTRAVYEQVAA